MSIYNRQYKKILAAELLRYLLLGRLPDLNDISKRIGDALGKDGNITYKYIPQLYKTVFNNNQYNKHLKSIKFDIDTFHEELIQLFSESANRLNYADLYHKINSYELQKLQSNLELLLFTVKDADFYFDGVVDTFSDNTKIDSSRSTKDVIDLSEQCLALPFGGRNTKRIDVGSLASTISTDIKLSRTTGIVSNRQIPNSMFGNIFTDTLSVWGHEVITDTNGPLELSFTFPININSKVESEFFISRFEVIPHILKKMLIKVTTSNDDVNYLPIVGYEQGMLLEDQRKTYAMDFETTLIQYVRVVLSKQEADEEILINDTKQYRYLFGLKKFASFQTGRFDKATYISKPLSFTTDEAISKVSIDAKQFIPNGCKILYSIAGVNDSGVESPFIPISPVGNDSSLGSNKIVKFNNTLERKLQFSVSTSGNDAAQVYGSSFQGKSFYRIGPVLTNKPIYGTNKLYRGFRSWYRDVTGSFEIINVNDTYVSFEQTDLEALYAIEKEVPQITNLGIGEDGVKRVQLQVTKPPYYDSSRGHGLKPQPGTQNTALDTRPNYAIYSIIHKSDTSRKTAPFVLTSSRSQYLPVNSFIIQGSIAAQLPVIRSTAGQIYALGVDYSFETIDIGGRSRPTGRISIPNGSSFLDSTGSVIPLMLEFVYTLDPDITHKVSRIDGNNIILDHSSNTQYDAIEITYRYIPVAPSQIIKSSIRVSNLPSTSPSRIFYVEGRDYVVDPTSGGIQRIPTGTIDTKGAVYAQFSYRGTSSLLQTFSTWAYVSPNDGSQVKFDLDPSTKKNKLVVDKDVGESFFVNTKDGIINLTNATSTPVLPNGWVQFIVRSKNPDTYQNYGSNLIDQVIQLKDTNKKKIFKQYNYYFNEITAFREPLLEKTLNHLKVNTLKSDHSNFAVDNTTDPLSSYIVLNFEPNTTVELYSKIPTEDSDESNPPESVNEDFLFIWNEKIDTDDAPNKIVIKIDLIRTQGIDGSVTPKVFEYQIRVGT